MCALTPVVLAASFGIILGVGMAHLSLWMLAPSAPPWPEKSQAQDCAARIGDVHDHDIRSEIQGET